jgi:hypothetical protein
MKAVSQTSMPPPTRNDRAGCPAPLAWLTPPQIAAARRLRVGKVLTWIRRGELRAINCAERPRARPRWRVSAEALSEFDAARSNRILITPAQPRATRGRWAEVTEYF